MVLSHEPGAESVPADMVADDDLVCRHQFPPAIIRHAVWVYVRLTLSYRDVEDLLAIGPGCLLRNGATMGLAVRPSIRPKASSASSANVEVASR